MSPRLVYETLCCARGQAENLIRAHKTHLASDRTSCRRALANQVRLVLHTAAYWLLLVVRDAIPAGLDLAPAEFATIRLRLMKIAVRVTETTSRIRLAFAAACPEAALVRDLITTLTPKPRAAGPWHAGRRSPQTRPLVQPRAALQAPSIPHAGMPSAGPSTGFMNKPG